MIDRQMLVNIESWGREFIFNFNQSVQDKVAKHKDLLNSIKKNFEIYGDHLVPYECSLIRDHEYSIEYKISNRLLMGRQWAFLGVEFYIIDVNEIGMTNFNGRIYTLLNDRSFYIEFEKGFAMKIEKGYHQ